jgi:hypothetical protein
MAQSSTMRCSRQRVSCTLKEAPLEWRQLPWHTLASKVPTSPVTNHSIDGSCRGMTTVSQCTAHPAACH